ncbi:MAG: hypothetical protein PHD31_01835, partial [Candidatus Pacebacteria bacterium]|nr:hypothetical protein [Candidatus Paceibacterota bacterium]
IMVIAAGFDYLTSAGDISKLSSAKKRFLSTAFGLVSLFGSYIILNTINSELLNVNINNLACEEGIVVKTDKGSTACIQESTPNIPYKIESTTSWNFKPDSATKVYKVYAYSDVNYGGTITDVPLDGSIPSSSKSVFIIFRKLGLYLYDDTGLKPTSANPYPFFTDKNIPDLNLDKLDNQIGSIDNLSSPPSLVYQAIVFTGSNYSGRCSQIIGGQSVSNLSSAEGSYYGPTIGADTLSSLIVFKSDNSTEPRGKVEFCDKINCPSGSVVCTIENDAGQIFSEYDGFSLGACKPPDGGTILSFRFSGNIGVVIRSSLGNCAYWNSNSPDLSPGNLKATLIESPVCPQCPIGTEKPQGYIIFPID